MAFGEGIGVGGQRGWEGDGGGGMGMGWWWEAGTSWKGVGVGGTGDKGHGTGLYGVWSSLHHIQPPKDKGPPRSLGSTHPGAAPGWWGGLGQAGPGALVHGWM